MRICGSCDALRTGCKTGWKWVLMRESIPFNMQVAMEIEKWNCGLLLENGCTYIVTLNLNPHDSCYFNHQYNLYLEILLRAVI